jgi:hypothetical protein
MTETIQRIFLYAVFPKPPAKALLPTIPNNDAFREKYELRSVKLIERFNS